MAEMNNVTNVNVQAWPKMLQRTNHFLMDYYGLQADYSAIVSYAESNPAAAVGQIIYAKADDLDGNHPSGLYVIKSYGEGAEVEAVGTGVAGNGGSAVIVDSYEDLEAACLDENNSGRIVILSQEVTDGAEEDAKTYLPGLYIIGSGTGISALEKISTSSADGSSIEDVVASLGTRIGTVETATADLTPRVAALEAIGAEKNVIESVSINGESVAVIGKNVDIEIPSASEYSLVKDSDSSDYAAVYHLTKDGENIGEAINIPKDMVVSSGNVVEKEESGEWGDAGTYIVLTLANAENDTLYIPVSSLIEYVTGGETSEISVSVDSNTHVATAVLKAGSIAEGRLDSALRAKLNGKVDREIVTDSGTALVFNESDGGGVKFEHVDGTEAFVGVNAGGENGLMAQIYADKNVDGSWVGSTIKVYHDKIFYQSKANRTSGRPNSSSEIATIGDLNAVIGEIKVDNSTVKRNSNGEFYVNTAALAVAGDSLGVVKNGGNVNVETDGSMNLIWSEME